MNRLRFSLKQSRIVYFLMRCEASLNLTVLGIKFRTFKAFRGWQWADHNTRSCTGAVNADWALFPKR